jgi:2-octaprenyl-6-methoxyphenol hydroxylase
MMLPNVTIAGCGLGGMISALALAKKNIPSTIIERRFSADKGFFADVRTTALTTATKLFFEEIDIWPSLKEFVGPINDIYVVDNKSPKMLHFASVELKGDEIMGHLIQNTDFKKVLYNLVQKHELITIIEGCSYKVEKNSPEGCSLLLNDTDTHNCDLLLVCDGRYSGTRQRFFSSNLEKSYDQSALTFLVKHEKPHEGTAVEHFMQTGPFAILPLKDPNMASIVWTIESDMQKLLENLPIDEFSEIVQDNFGEFLGKIQIQGDIAGFPLKAYEADRYFNKRIALIADTAHVIHPLAGQGLNQGIKDINCFVSLLIEYGISDDMLNQYQKLRKTDNSNMLEITDTINTVFSNKSKILQATRKVGFQAIEKIIPFKKLLIKYAMGRR